MTTEPNVVDAPTLPEHMCSSMIYQVNVAGGSVLTNPGMFVSDDIDNRMGVRWGEIAERLRQAHLD